MTFLRFPRAVRHDARVIGGVGALVRDSDSVIGLGRITGTVAPVMRPTHLLPPTCRGRRRVPLLLAQGRVNFVPNRGRTPKELGMI